MAEEEMRSLSSEIPISKYQKSNKNIKDRLITKLQESNKIVKQKSRLAICSWILLLFLFLFTIVMMTCLIRMFTVMVPEEYDGCINDGLYEQIPTLDNATINRLQKRLKVSIRTYVNNTSHKYCKISQLRQRLTRIRLKVIQEKTIAYDIKKINNASFIKLHKTLKKLFPRLHSHASISRTIINKFSLLYKIEGTDKDLKPYLLNTHLDVVPVDGQDWSVDPFEGILKNGFIYGRGTIDMKQILTAILESIERLIQKNYKFKRTFYIGCGQDEEVYGLDGSGEIAKHLISEGVTEFEYIIDEGVPILQGLIKGIDRPVLIVGIAEKGIATLELSVNGDAGHSSLPKYPSNIGILSKAIVNLESERQPIYFEGVARKTFEALAPYMGFFKRFLLSNLWLFSGLLKINLAKDEMNNALIRTTAAVTIFKSGMKDNVIPETATAILNHRIHPLQPFQEVLETDKSIINDDRVHIKTLMHLSASGVSSTNTSGYKIIKKAISKIFNDVLVIPGLCIARTDSSQYANFTDNIYRLDPVLLNKEDIKRIHGIDERISIESYRKVIEFYTLVIKLGDEDTLTCNNK